MWRSACVQLLDCGISQRDYLTARLAVSERDKRVVRGTGVRNLKNPHSLVDDRSHIAWQRMFDGLREAFSRLLTHV
jgi:hypothetical protein